MIDTHIYDYDTYSRDTEMSTYLCAESVMSDIDAYLCDRSNLAFDSDMVFPLLLERNLHLAAENKVLRTVLDNYNWIDIDTKSISGANVEAVRDVATKIAYSGKDIKDISVDEFYEMTEDIRKDVMSMDDNINDLYGDVTLWRSEYYSYDENAKLSERFSGCYELGLLSSDNSGKLNAYLSECLSPTKSFKLSESRTEHTNSPLLLDNVADV